MKEDIRDFELPPLPQETDFPADIGDIDENDPQKIQTVQEAIPVDTGKITITDMEDNPVEAPPAEDYKSARRRIRLSRIKYVYTERKPRRSIDEFYEQRQKEHEQSVKGRKDALVFCCCFCALAAAYAVSCPGSVTAAAAAAEIFFAVFIAKGSNVARIILFILFPINFILGIMSFFGVFDRFIQFMNELFKKTVINDPFTKWAYLAVSLLSAAAFIYLLRNKEIAVYCSDPENDIDDKLTSDISKKRFF